MRLKSLIAVILSIGVIPCTAATQNEYHGKFVGDGSQLTGIVAAGTNAIDQAAGSGINIVSNSSILRTLYLDTNAVTAISSTNHDLTKISTNESRNITMTGSNYFTGTEYMAGAVRMADGSLLATNMTARTNASGGNALQVYGNLTAYGSFIGDGSLLTGLPAGTFDTSGSYILTGSNTFAGPVSFQGTGDGLTIGPTNGIWAHTNGNLLVVGLTNLGLTASAGSPLTVDANGKVIATAWGGPAGAGSSNITDSGYTVVVRSNLNVGGSSTFSNVAAGTLTLSTKINSTNINAAPINVLDYGAVSGGGNATAAIQAALDAVPANGGTVIIPKGSFTSTGTLYPHNGTIIQGEGSAFGVGTYIGHGAADTPVFVLSNSSIQIKGLYIEGTSTANGYGIITSTNAAFPSQDFKLVDVRVGYFKKGIVLANAWTAELISCYVSKCGDGLVLSNTVNQIQMFGGHISDCTNGVWMDGTANHGVNLWGVGLENSTNNIYGTGAVAELGVFGCYFERGGYHIYLNGGSSPMLGVNIRDCVMMLGQTNVHLNNVTKASVRDNTVFDSGVFLEADSSCTKLTRNPNIYSGAVYDASTSPAGVDAVAAGASIASADGGNLTNLVPKRIVAGANVTITTNNPNTTSETITIASTAGGAAVTFTNAQFAWADIFKTNYLSETTNLWARGLFRSVNQSNDFTGDLHVGGQLFVDGNGATTTTLSNAVITGWLEVDAAQTNKVAQTNWVSVGAPDMYASTFHGNATSATGAGSATTANNLADGTYEYAQGSKLMHSATAANATNDQTGVKLPNIWNSQFGTANGTNWAAITTASKLDATVAAITNLLPKIITNATSALIVSNNVSGVPNNGYIPKLQADGTVAWAADATGSSSTVFQSHFASANGPTIYAGATRYFSMNGTLDASSNDDVDTIWPATCTFTNLYLRTIIANPNTNVTFTLYSNGVATLFLGHVIGHGAYTDGSTNASVSTPIPAGTKVCIGISHNCVDPITTSAYSWSFESY